MHLNTIHILRMGPGGDVLWLMYKEIALAITAFTQGSALMGLSEAALAGFLST